MGAWPVSVTPQELDQPFADYDPFAWVYNEHWSGPFAAQVMTALDALLLPGMSGSARILDLCCGTGQLAAKLTGRGFAVTGVDGSSEMLRYARVNAPSAEFVHADARDLRGEGQFDAVVCVFDSLNHILNFDELVTVFRNVRAALSPEGRFLFDLNMEQGYIERCLGSHTIVDDDNASIVDVDYTEEEHLASFEITLFHRDGPGWSRTDLTLLQRCYSEPQVRDALADAGFGDISVHEAESELGMDGNVGRSFFLASAV
jgi:SAM-dependent methyltransferase